MLGDYHELSCTGAGKNFFLKHAEGEESGYYTEKGLSLCSRWAIMGEQKNSRRKIRQDTSEKYL